MSLELIIFIALTIFTLSFSVMVITLRSPIHSALSLVMVILGLSGFFISLDAVFIAFTQIIIYAGAVMVLFVMVIMIFDFQNETRDFTSNRKFFFQLIIVSLLAGIIFGSCLMSIHLWEKQKIEYPFKEKLKNIGYLLFNEHMINFQLLGVIFLVVAVGVIVLIKSNKKKI